MLGSWPHTAQLNMTRALQEALACARELACIRTHRVALPAMPRPSPDPCCLASPYSRTAPPSYLAPVALLYST